MPGLLEKAFIEPFQRLAEQLAVVVPALITVLVILIVGGALAYLARLLTYRLLVATHFDRLMIQTGVATTIDRARVFRSPSDFGARLVQGMLWMFIILLALSATNAQMTQDLVVRFVNYVPDIIAATLVLLLGSVVSKFLARSALLAAVNSQWSGARLIAGGVRLLVMSLAVVIALEQLRIGRTALLVTFGILFGGIVIGGAIAFGLVAKDLAREWVHSILKSRASEDEGVFRHL
jgi:Conserved TM helix